MNAWPQFRLRNAPLPVKVFALAYLCVLSVGYLYAMANIALVIGFTPKDIAVHYYGSAEEIKPKASPTGEQPLDFDQLSAEAKVVEHPRPSLKNLVQEGHFHLFGMSSFFFGLCLIGLFTGGSDRAKAFMVGLPFAAVLVDNLSFLATRFLGPQFAFLTALAGSLMAFSFAWIWFAIIKEVLYSRKGINT
jgi:hypothetical protein